MNLLVLTCLIINKSRGVLINRNGAVDRYYIVSNKKPHYCAVFNEKSYVTIAK